MGSNGGIGRQRIGAKEKITTRQSINQRTHVVQELRGIVNIVNKAVKAAPEAAVAWVEGGSSSSPLPWEIRPMLSVKSD